METSELKKKRKLPWWVKWLGIPLLVVGVLVAAWFSWYLYAWSQFNKEIDALKTAGWPTTRNEMIPPHVPDEDNALLAYEQATEEMSAAGIPTLWDSIRSKMRSDGYYAYGVSSFQGFPELRKAYPNELRLLMNKSDKCFAQCIKASQMKGVRWTGWPYPSHQILKKSVDMPYGDLPSLLALRVIVSHEQNDDVQSIQGLHVLFHLSDVSALPTDFECVWVSTEIESHASSAVEEITCTLLSGTSFTKKTEQQVRTLIKRITDETMASQRLLSYCKTVTYDVIAGTQSRLLPGPHTPRWKSQRGPFAPIYISNAAQLLSSLHSAFEAASQIDYPALLKKLGTWSIEPSFGGIRLSGFLEDILWNDSEQHLIYGGRHFHSLARRRMAAIALAIRLYELDHGTRPETLTQLVPNYLSQVPVDPFEATGKPIQYLPKAKYPRLYSVGVDGIDEGGNYADDPDSPPVHNKFDLPFFLTPNKPREKIQKTNTEN